MPYTWAPIATMNKMKNDTMIARRCLLLLFATLLLASCHKNYAKDYAGAYKLHYEIDVEELGTVVYSDDDTLTIIVQGDDGDLTASCSAFSLSGWADADGLHFDSYTTHTVQTDAVIDADYSSADVTVQDSIYSWSTPVVFVMNLNAGVTLNYNGTQSHQAVRM